VAPAEVRLITTRDDPYSWKVLPGKEHLFEKQMSKHSIGAYMELFREVGSSFEAALGSGTTTRENRTSNSGLTFSSKIAELERHKSSLLEDLCRSQSRIEQAEKELESLKSAILALEQRDARQTELIKQYRDITVKSLEDARSAFEKHRLLAQVGERG
jgi:chromosome segregation ATPase